MVPEQGAAVGMVPEQEAAVGMVPEKGAAVGMVPEQEAAVASDTVDCLCICTTIIAGISLGCLNVKLCVKFPLHNCHTHTHTNTHTQSSVVTCRRLFGCAVVIFEISDI